MMEGVTEGMGKELYKIIYGMEQHRRNLLHGFEGSLVAGDFISRCIGGEDVIFRGYVVGMSQGSCGRSKSVVTLPGGARSSEEREIAIASSSVDI